MRRIVTSSALLAGMLASHAMAAGPSEADISRALHQEMVAEVRQYVAGVLARAEFVEKQGAGAQVQFADDTATGIPVQVKDGEVFVQGGKLVPRPTEKGAYLGVGTGAMTGALRHQLNLPKGTGLVVMYVDKDSPAGAAGIQQDDVIEKLDDQILVNGPQLAVLVRDKKAGESVTLTIIRGGQSLTVTAKLAEKELPVLDDGEQPGFMPVPQAWNGAFTPMDGGGGWQRGVRKTIVDSKDGTITRKWNDGQDEITLTTTPDGQSNVVIKDETGKEVFSGPYTKEEDKRKVPAEFAGRIEDLQKSAARVTLQGADGKNSVTADSVTITRTDADQSITLTITGKRRNVVVKDVKTLETVYDGGANTEEDFGKMPAGVAEKVRGMMEKVHVGG